ncbi:zinc finger protein 91-like [Mytilus trossulus]|uniref:zinc finger protein 91-like n=1 Tax=Mytilus trossulus TaxID=6551 RepID=UPI003007DB12
MADSHHLLPLADYLYKLYKSQSLCDLSIITQNGTTVLAHKLVVAAFSETVRTEVEKWKDLPQVSIVVDCETAVLKEILEFVYIGNCHLHKELFPLLQQASHSLQIPSLQKYLKDKGPISRKSLQKNLSTDKQKKEETKALPNKENLRSRRNKKPKKDEQFEWSDDLQEPDEAWVPGDHIPTAADDDGNDGYALWENEVEVRNEPRTSRRKSKPGKLDKLIIQAYVRLERIDASVKDTSLKNTLRSTVPNKDSGYTVKKSLIPMKERKNRYTRENLTNLAKTKRTRNKNCHPLMNHSEHSIEKIKHSMHNWKKSSAELLAWKCKKLYEKHHKDIRVKRVGYSCKICKVWHKNISRIKLHINVKHRNIQPRKRKFANKTKKKGSFEERKKKIERIKQKIKNCECFRCDRTYKLVRGLATHLVEKHKISFETAQKLTGYPKYFKYQNPTSHTCDECKMEFNTLNDYRAHCRIVHKKKRLEPDMSCTYKKCSQKFLSMAKLKEHLVKFHKQKNVSIKCRQGRVSARVDKQDITTRLQKQRRLLEDLSVSSKEEQVKRKKEESFIKQINELSEITESQRSSYPKKKIKYNVILPSKKYKCNRCPKSSVCRNKLIHKNHREIRHKKILVSKVFESQLVLKKRICQSFSCVKFVNKDPNNLKPKSKEDATHSGVPRQEQNALEQRDMSSHVQALRHSIANEHNSVDFLPFQAPNITSQFGGYLSLLQDSALNEQSGLFEFSNTCNNDSPGSLQKQSNGKQKRCKRNQFTCLKCGLSFHYYSSASLHFKKKHQKNHLGQRTVFSSLKKHVNLRSVLFSRKSLLKTSTFQLQFAEERSTTCQICEKTFSHVRSLARHLQNTHCCTFEQTRNTTGYPSKIAKKKEEITCVDCKKTFTNIRNLATHLQNVHKYTFEQAREATGYPAFIRVTKLTKKKKTKCEKCSEIFETMKDFRVHEVIVHGLPCKYCGEKFLHLVSLKKHGVRDHPEHFDEFEEMKATSKAWILDEDENENTEDENYKCDNCDFSTRKLNILTVHVMEVHPEVQHHCPTCGYSFRSQYSVDLHTSKHHGEAEKKKPVCIFCSKKFLRKRFLRIHQFKAHGILHPDVKQYKCDAEGCIKIAYTATELRQHKRNHTAEKRFPCQQCNFVCAHRHRLLRHVRTVHLQLKPALCESCGKSFTTEQHMKEHIRRYHTNDYYELQCDYCSFQCGVRNQLQTHVWNQHQMKMAGDSRQYYQCDRCPYQTPLKCKFNNHMNGHNNIRNYVCDQCDSRFVTSSTLRTHKQWKHSSKEEDKICSHCGYKTKTSNKLNEHIRVQHQLKGVKPYHCTYCDFKCATGGNCRKHIMAKHKDLPVHYTCDTEYLEIARMARQEGNTNPLIVHTANDTHSDNQIAQSPATFTQIVPNFEQLPPADHLMFDPVRYEKL